MGIENIEKVNFTGLYQLKMHIVEFKRWKWLLIVFLIMILVIGVLAEELYFRAYLFEKQALLFGKYMWIINGISWSVIHVFTKTNIVAILPTAFFISYVYQRRKNFRIPFIAHFIMNTLAYFEVVRGYLNM